jgi:hypothetical protein
MPLIDWHDYTDAVLGTFKPRYGAPNDPAFDTLLTAIVRKADDENLAALESAFPEKVAEIRARYNATGGLLPDDSLAAYVEVYGEGATQAKALQGGTG